MLLAISILIGLVIGLIAGGRWQALAEWRVRWIWLALVSFAIQWLVVKFEWRDLSSGLINVFIVGAALAGVFALRNWRLPGMSVIFAGLVLNLVVMLANGGHMPVTPELLTEAGRGDKLAAYGVGQPLPQSKDIPLPAGAANLWFLSDVFVSPPAPFRFVFSPGDVLLAAGGAYFAFRATRGVRPARPLPTPAQDPAAI